MKKLVLGCILTIGSASVMAEDIKLVPADDSPYTQACLAAAESRSALEDVRMEQGLSLLALSETRCNGRPLRQFATIYGNRSATVETRALSQNEASFSFNLESDNIETRLCHAAVTSTEEFQQLREEHFAHVDLDTQIQCNGMPISRFAKKYSTEGFISSSR